MILEKEINELFELSKKAIEKENSMGNRLHYRSNRPIVRSHDKRNSRN